jgi:hypothetical protein
MGTDSGDRQVQTLLQSEPEAAGEVAIGDGCPIEGWRREPGRDRTRELASGVV